MPPPEWIKDLKPQGKIIVGGEECSLFNDEHYAKVRECFGWDPALLENKEAFSFGNLKEGGGKGGGLMAWSKDHRWIVKDVSGDDHMALSTIAPAYAERVTCGGSLLARFFMHLHRLADNKHYVVMNSWLPVVNPVATIYDLKGTADDKLLMQMGQKVDQVHKRWYKTHWLVAEGVGAKGAVPKARQIYYQGKKHAFTCKFKLTPEARAQVMGMIKGDVEWLQDNGLMDYSLIVGENIEHVGEGTFTQMGNSQPYVSVHDGEVHSYYFGIIDFLQPWTAGKKVAHVIKVAFAPKPISTVPPTPYGNQFLKFFDNKFVDSEDNKFFEAPKDGEVTLVGEK